MNAKARTVLDLRTELDRVAAGGDIDRAGYVKWMTLAVTQLEDWRTACEEAWDERADFAKRCTSAAELVSGLGMVLDVAHRACRGEVDPGRPIEFARDTAPFRNIMSTMYGLGPCGEDLPKRKPRKTRTAV